MRQSNLISTKHCVVFWSITRTFLTLPALYLSTEVLFFIVWIRSNAFLDSDLTDRNEILYLLLSFHLMDMEEENRNARS